MKKKYLSPDFDLYQVKFESVLEEHLIHSNPEGGAEGGAEGPDQ